MALKFADGLTTAAKLGSVDCFTTFTTNPKWTEIVEAMGENESHEDNPVIVNRVFKAKLAAFLEDLRQGTFFEGRKLVYIIHVVEFQWRGLPHAHIVYKLEGNKFTPLEIDRLWTTSYANLTPEEKMLSQGFMTHKCNQSCSSNGKCESFYPKPLAPTSTC